MTEHVRVAVIGGGIVGASVLYWLSRLGWSDCILLERRNLTSGSTWHAAGNVTFFGHYAAITSLYIDSVRTYLDAEAESGRPVGFHPAGSLRLASTERELDAYRKLTPAYKAMGVDYAVIAPEAIAALHPLLNLDGILGAAHTPEDGHLDPGAATHALASAARQRGAMVKTRCPVKAIERDAGGWRLICPDEIIIAEHVVVAASFWSRELLAPLGLSLPLFPLEHHEIITDTVPELTMISTELPTVRDPWAPSNTRQEGPGFLCGVYEANPVPWGVDGIPKGFKEDLLAPDLDRLTPHLERVIQRLPAFGAAGIKAVNNGPICYTPDGLPLVGPVSTHPGLWLAAGFAIGIGTGGGSARLLANWMVNGSAAPGHDVVHADRFDPEMTRDEAIWRICQTYSAGYPVPAID